VKTYGERPELEDAKALVRRRINIQMKHRMPGDLRNRFELVPILHRISSTISDRDYYDRQWGVLVDGEMIGYVRKNRSGKTKFLAYGMSPSQYRIDDDRLNADDPAGSHATKKSEKATLVKLTDSRDWQWVRSAAEGNEHAQERLADLLGWSGDNGHRAIPREFGSDYAIVDVEIDGSVYGRYKIK
jgi:hypothetical protein